MKKAIIFVILVLVLAGAGYWAYYNYIKLSPSVWIPVEINSASLPSVLEQFRLVDDLPEDSRIEINVGSNSYIVEKGNVEVQDGESNSGEVDAKVSLPEKYFEVFGEKGWCEGLKEANANGDLGVEIKEGKKKDLLWKYKSLVKYKSCLG